MFLTLATYRSSHSQLFYRGVFKNFAKFTGKQLCWSLFLIKLWVLQNTSGLLLQLCWSLYLIRLKAYSNLQNISGQVYYRTPPGDRSDSFCGAGGETTSCLKLVRIMLET